MADPDPETVSFLPSYRVGFQPPKPGDLAAGELYVEVGDGETLPQLWIGALGKGVAVMATASEVMLPEPAPTAPPVNVDVPYASQDGAVLECTMGNWEGVPDSYTYQWRLDGTDIPVPGEAQYTVLPGDIGKTATCVVTATNALGSTVAPPSNEVIVT